MRCTNPSSVLAPSNSWRWYPAGSRARSHLPASPCCCAAASATRGFAQTLKTSDIVLLALLWLQLVLGLGTIPLSAQHLDGGMMLKLAGWAQHIVTFQPGAAGWIEGASWVFKAHMVLGMSLFLIFPFTRLVHVWSGFATLAYLLRPWQVVRDRRLNLPASHRTPVSQRRP